MTKHRDVELHREAFTLFVQGLTLGEIASQLGVSPNTLKYWKSAKCQCTCSYHNWLDYKKKVQVQAPVPQTVVEAVCDALIPSLTAKQMVKRLEIICANELNRPEGLRPKTWKELIETFKLLVDLRRTYGVSTDDDDDDEVSVTREITEIHTIKGKVELHDAIDSFVKGMGEKKKRNQGEIVDLLIDQSKEGV